MDNPIVQQGLSLMLYGMGTVIFFLTLLIFTTTGISAIVQRWFPDKEKPVVDRKPKKPASAASNLDPVTLQVIQAAVAQHRKRVR